VTAHRAGIDRLGIGLAAVARPAYITAGRAAGLGLRVHGNQLGPGPGVALAVELTTHAGHFLGRAISRILVWEDAEGAWIRDVGSWDPLPPELAAAYALGGRTAQHAFWGPERPEQSMLAQIALAAAP